VAFDGDFDNGGSLTLEGVLLDGDSQPIAEGLVWLDHGTKSLSDQSGRFAFDNLAPNLYRLHACKDDLVCDLVLVTLRENRAPVVLTLTPGIRLEIRVLAEDAPVADAQIKILDEVVAVTDSDGRAIVRGLGDKFQLFEVVADAFAPAAISLWLAPDAGGTIERTVQLVRGASVQGHVENPSGAPVAGVEVHLCGPWIGRTKTDANGIWRFKTVAPGAYIVCAGPFVSPEPTGPVVELDGINAVENFAVRLETGALVRGSVIDTNAVAARRAFVVATKVGVTFPEDSTKRCSDDGTFEIDGLTAGTYRVFAHFGKHASPNVEVVLTDGENEPLQLILEPASIAGTVVDENGAPVAGAHAGESSLIRGDVSGADGRFDLGAFPRGEYEIAASLPGQFESAANASAMVPSGTTDVKLVVAPLATIVGRVLFEGAPMQYFGVLLTQAPQFPWIGHPTGIRANDGRFEMRGLPAGRTALVIAGPRTALHTIGPMNVDAGQRIDLGDIHLVPGQRVAGHVRNMAGAPVSNARVVLGNRRRERDDTGTDPLQQWFHADFVTTTGEDGAFVFEGVTSLRAPNARPSPISASHSLYGSSVGIAIPENDVPIDLVLVECGSIKGVVAGYAGEFAYINAQRVGAPFDLRDAPVEKNGTFLIENLPPAEYHVTMTSLPDRPTAAPITIAVVPEQCTSAELILVPENRADVGVPDEVEQ
jgi:hypothetical protein